MDSLYALLLPSPINIVPAIRIELDQELLGQLVDNNQDETSNETERLIDGIIYEVSSKQIVIIFNVRWPAADRKRVVAGENAQSRSKQIVAWLSAKYGSNPFVWYQFHHQSESSYNEHADNVESFIEARGIRGVVLKSTATEGSNLDGIDRTLLNAHQAFVVVYPHRESGTSSLRETSNSVFVMDIGQVCCDASERKCFLDEMSASLMEHLESISLR